MAGSRKVFAGGNASLPAPEVTDADPMQVTVLANTSPKSIKTVTGSISATTTVIPAVTGKRIKVRAISLITASATAQTWEFDDGPAGTALWTVPMQALANTNFGVNLAVPAPDALFATSAGNGLSLKLTGTGTVVYSISYFDDDAA